MNQNYLLGRTVDKYQKESLVYFKATPENIASFLCTNQWNPFSEIYTVDGKPFLSARTGLIDTMPDQKYLIEQLQPVLIPMQTGRAPIPKLDTVTQEIAEAEPCPQPDWNYLRWEGYDDARYQAIMDGGDFLEWEQFGETHRIELRVQTYVDDNNLAIEMVSWDKGEPGPWSILTVNLDGRRGKDCAFINVNHLGDKILPWLEKNGLARPTGRVRQSGFVSYPEYHFNTEKLQQMDAKGYREYLQRYEEAQKQHPSPKIGGDAR